MRSATRRRRSRDLSVSLNNVGNVERDLGDLVAAREAYRESLAIDRQLRHALGDTRAGAS